MPLDLGVVLLVYLPIEESAFNRVKLHEHFGNLPKPVENILSLLVGNFVYPPKVLQENVWAVEVYSAVGGDQGQPMEVWLGRRHDWHFVGLHDAFDPFQSRGGNIAIGVLVAHFDDVVAAALRLLDQVL